MLASGTMTASEVARQIGCSPSTLYRHVPGDAPPLQRAGAPAGARNARSRAFTQSCKQPGGDEAQPNSI